MTDEIDDAAQQRSDQELVWRCVASQAGPELKLFGVRLDEMEHPRSHEVMQRLVLTSVDWVNVVAVTDRGAVVMVRQYRFGAGYTTLETPGGMVDPGEERPGVLALDTQQGAGWHLDDVIGRTVTGSVAAMPYRGASSIDERFGV